MMSHWNQDTYSRIVGQLALQTPLDTPFSLEHIHRLLQKSNPAQQIDGEIVQELFEYADIQ